MLLTYTHKCVVESQKHIAVYVSFQSDRVFLACQSHLPYTQIAVVCEESDVVDVYQTEVDGIGIDDIFAVVAPCYAVADDCRGCRSGCSVLMSMHTRRMMVRSSASFMGFRR